MTDDELKHAAAVPGAHRSASTGDATWRYLGDRAAADGAYCARFGVPVAPAPDVVPGGVWVYALPSGTTA